MVHSYRRARSYEFMPAGVDARPRTGARSLMGQLADLAQDLRYAVRTLRRGPSQIRVAVDVSDPNAGFLMTPWQASLARDGVPELRYRTRIVLRFLGDDWKQLAVRTEANWLRGEEWQVGYDAALLDSVSANLTTRLGKHP